MSLLTPIVPVASAGSIVPGRDGVVLDCDGRRAIFLPEVGPHHGWTREELLSHLAEKAGLPAAAWRRGRLATFRTERFGEPADQDC